ncbi:MAG: hypothetical protein FJY54_00250 [Betaproteobacteria bacterium]|nr:hypothetical protein [Betaproteobacteria bacterium]
MSRLDAALLPSAFCLLPSAFCLLPSAFRLPSPAAQTMPRINARGTAARLPAPRPCRRPGASSSTSRRSCW